MATIKIIELLQNHPFAGSHAWIEVELGEHTITLRLDQYGPRNEHRPALFVRVEGDDGSEKDMVL